MRIFPLLQTGGAGQYMFFIALALVFFIFYFLLIRPQRKEQKEREAQIAGVKKGDKIITIGGIHGFVTLTKERTVVIKVDEGCKIEINRSAIAIVLQEKKEEPNLQSPSKDIPQTKEDNNEYSEEKKSSFFGRFKKKNNKKDNA